MGGNGEFDSGTNMRRRTKQLWVKECDRDRIIVIDYIETILSYEHRINASFYSF